MEFLSRHFDPGMVSSIIIMTLPLVFPCEYSATPPLVRGLRELYEVLLTGSVSWAQSKNPILRSLVKLVFIPVSSSRGLSLCHACAVARDPRTGSMLIR